MAKEKKRDGEEAHLPPAGNADVHREMPGEGRRGLQKFTAKVVYIYILK